MSVYESIHLVDTANLDSWVSRANATSSFKELRSLITDVVQEARAQDRDDLRDWLDEHIDSDDDAPAFFDIGDLLALLLSKQTWNLGNALGRGAEWLEFALRVTPALEPLDKALKQQRDLGKLRGIAEGLTVTLDSKSASALLPIVQAWSDRGQVISRISSTNSSFINRLMGRQKTLREWASNQEAWERWSNLCEAVKALADSSGQTLIWETEV